MSNYHVEIVNDEDVGEIQELLGITWRATYGKYYPLEAVEKITMSWHNSQALLSQLHDPNIYFAAAKEGEKIAGIITIRKVDDMTIFLNRLYVLPDFQGKGIGTLLLKSAFDHFPAAKKIRVECEKQNGSGCGFYMKQGFQVIGEKNEVVEGVAMTAVEFEKEIPR